MTDIFPSFHLTVPYLLCITVYVRYTHFMRNGAAMNIMISNTSGKPIYDQITEQIKDQVISGALSPCTPLPSMRLLAKELRISVITTKRAYAELEKDGFIDTVVGKGSYVRQANTELIKEEQLKLTEQSLSEAIAHAKKGGVTLPELIEILTLLYKEE